MALDSIQWIINILLIYLIVLYTLSIVVVTRVYSVITLIFSYIIVSVIALLYHQTFIAVVLLMVYAGAISIFFIFMVMLLNTQRRGTGYRKLTIGGFLLFFAIFTLVGGLVVDNFYNMLTIPSESIEYGRYNMLSEEGGLYLHTIRDIYNVALENYEKVTVPKKFVDIQDAANDFVGKDFVTSQLTRIGLALYSAYIYAFIGAGLLLLVAIVGVTSLFNYTPRLQKSREEDNIQILRGLKKK